MGWPRHLGAWVLVLPLLWGVGPAQAAPDDESSKGYIEMPEPTEGEYVLAAPSGSGRNWGRPVFVRFLVMVAREWKRRHPEGPVLRIGDMSKPDGSDFPPHKTHKDGLTADLFTYPQNACHVSYPDQELTLELAELMHDLGARQILYNGDLVVERVPVAQKWPKHDDHFHVVIDPSRVPEEGEVLVLPPKALADGGFVGASALDEDRSGLTLSWRVLGRAPLKHVRVLFDDFAEGEVLHDSGPVRLREMAYRVPVALEHGERYRWRVELVGAEDELVAALDWQALTADLVPPEVEALAPKDDAEHDAPPVLTWRFSKPGVAQASYVIELDTDSSHRRVAATLGPFEGAAPRHALGPDVPLRRNKRYYWRVVVRDAHGNEAASEWCSFKTGYAFDRAATPQAPSGGGAGAERAGVVTASALNMRRGPGTGHAVIRALPKGTEVRVVREAEGGWLEVDAIVDGQAVRGFVHGGYVELR